jgi:hypothetical protein
MLCIANDDIWTKFKTVFPHIISQHEYYGRRLTFLQEYENNVLLYGTHGFPTDLFLNEVIKGKYDLNSVHKSECLWNKELPYYHNPYFLEINMMHPIITKSAAGLCPFLINVIKTRNVSGSKHLIIIKNIDLLNKDNSISFRIILERFSNNAYFLCTAHNLDKIDQPIKSRFSMIRMPLFSHAEIKDIFENQLHTPLNVELAADKNMRNIVKAIYISADAVEVSDANLNFPPITEIIRTKCTLQDVRQFAYKCFQYNVSIPELVHDLLILCPKNKKTNIVKTAAEIEHLVKQSSKGREALYIEAFLCKIFFG